VSCVTLPDRDALRISRLRAPAGGDPLAARLRLERLLCAADLRPRGLAPGAVLAVRRLRDPRPGLLSLSGAEVRPPAAWEAAVAERLANLARHAARPAAGPVPAGAEAVLFPTREELLSCLASDLVSGDAAGRWWWEALYPGGALLGTLHRELRETPEVLPPVLERVVRLRGGGAVGSVFPTAVAAELVRALVDRRGLRELSAAMAQPHAAAGFRAPPAATPWTCRASEPAPGPWESVAPEARRAGAAPVELLFGVALALRRRPELAASSAFARDVAAWRTGASLALGDPPAFGPPPEPCGGSPAATPASAALPATTSPDLRKGADPDDASGALAARSASTLAPSPEAQHAPRHDEPAPPEPEPPEALAAAARPALAHARSAAAPRAERGATDPARTREARTVGAEPVPEPVASLAGESITTGVGGLFFLLNLALHLGLYADFTRPRETGVPLSPWDLLDLLGRRLLGVSALEDPIWTLLARLAGRGEGEPAGGGFDAPLRWRVPRGWLAPFGAETRCRRVRSSAGLRLEHPAGFCAVERPRDAGRADRAAARDRWVGWLAAYARARLRLGLGLAGGESDELAPVLLLRRARVLTTETRVDVVFELADHPIALRLSGLDRDPGWIPAATRHVAFHFE
jgi:hypothetical protein